MTKNRNRKIRTTHLVHTVADPVDAGVPADGLVLGIDQDDLVVLVGGVVVDPVGVEDAEVSAATTDTLLGGGLQSTLVLELIDTHVGGLACTPGLASTFLTFFSSINPYHRWHPWGQGACGHRVSHGHGTQHSPAWPCSPDDGPCRGGKDGTPGGWHSIDEAILMHSQQCSTSV